MHFMRPCQLRIGLCVSFYGKQRNSDTHIGFIESGVTALVGSKKTDTYVGREREGEENRGESRKEREEREERRDRERERERMNGHLWALGGGVLGHPPPPSMQKCPEQGLNLHHSSDLSHSSDNTRSLTARLPGNSSSDCFLSHLDCVGQNHPCQ